YIAKNRIRQYMPFFRFSFSHRFKNFTVVWLPFLLVFNDSSESFTQPYKTLIPNSTPIKHFTLIVIVHFRLLPAVCFLFSDQHVALSLRSTCFGSFCSVLRTSLRTVANAGCIQRTPYNVI